MKSNLLIIAAVALLSTSCTVAKNQTTFYASVGKDAEKVKVPGLLEMENVDQSTAVKVGADAVNVRTAIKAATGVTGKALDIIPTN